jgi:hypothetical protein
VCFVARGIPADEAFVATILAVLPPMVEMLVE